MQHKAKPRDATIPLVVALIAVIGLVLVLSQPGNGSADNASNDANRVSAPLSDTPSPTPTPIPTPTITPEATAPPQKVRQAPGPFRKLRKTCVPRPGDTELTAVSYNIKSGQARGGLGALAATIQASGADVVLLQEVDRMRNGSGRVDQPAYFASRLGMFSAFDPNVSYGGASQYGTAILSKYPITSTSNVDLPRPGATQQRGLARAVIDVDGKEVAIYNTHLQNLSESARIQQINRIVQIASLDPLPQIFGGDMNAHYGSPVMGIARRHYIDTWDVVGTGDGRTHPATNLRGRIDYLMHANEGITAITSDVLAPVQSDHKAVRATYTVEGEGGRDCVLEKPEF